MSKLKAELGGGSVVCLPNPMKTLIYILLSIAIMGCNWPKKVAQEPRIIKSTTSADVSVPDVEITEVDETLNLGTTY